MREGGPMATTEPGHRPVMTDRVLALLAPALEPTGSVMVDATLGRAGHASALLRQHPGLTLIGVDADDAAIEESRELLAPYAERVTLVRARYDTIGEILAGLGYPNVNGVLFDLGVSSPQLDDPGRGFAYSHDAPLDMRMDRSGALTAAEVVNTYSAARLAQVLREYGEERFARRIAVNDELETLSRALPAALDLLAVGGRIVVLAYHSLEDRAVKRALAAG